MQERRKEGRREGSRKEGRKEVGRKEGRKERKKMVVTGEINS